METKVLTVDRLKELLVETFYNKQDKVTKISDLSVAGAFFYGMAKIGQKALVDIATVEAQLFPEFATGSLLDDCAVRLGVPARFTARGSSTFVRLVGAAGTQYTYSDITLTSTSGVLFELTEDITIPNGGYVYANVRSKDTGKKTIVPPNSITRLSPAPVGHEYVINEFSAIGGADQEDDQEFLQRIINYPNILSENTLEKLNQVFISINNKVLRTLYYGLDVTGKNRLAIVTQNGSQLTQTELDELLSGAQDYISISDLRRYGNNILGVKLENVDFYPIDIDFRADIIQNYDPDEIRIEIQSRFARKIDYRFWNEGDVVQWDDLLALVKDVQGVRSVPDKKFFPQTDVEIPVGQFPRFRGFIMRDLDGNIIVDKQGYLNPVYFSSTLGEVQNIL